MIDGYSRNEESMDDVKVLGVKESGIVGCWVLATVEDYQGAVYYELTFPPDIQNWEWLDSMADLPAGVKVRLVQGVNGEMLGRRYALMATIR